MVFFTKLTALGLVKNAAADAGGTNVLLTHMAIGDGDGAPVAVPTGTETELVNERARMSIVSLTIDPEDPTVIVIDGIFPSNIGGWYVHEVGIYDADGDLYAYGNFPATYKPVVAEGSAREMTVRASVRVANAEVVEIVINPSLVYATQAWVLSVLPEDGVLLGNTAGAALAAAGAAGVADTAARSDHVHPRPTPAQIGAEPSFGGGTNSQYLRGDKSWVDFATAVRAATLTGFSTVTNAAVVAADTVLAAFGKVQAQINAHFGQGGATHPAATTAVNGFMSAADKTKLNGIATGAAAVGNTAATALAAAASAGASASASREDHVHPRPTPAEIGAEPAIAAGTTAQYRRGDKAWRDFATDVRDSVLTGLSMATNAAITAADTVMTALGKVQAQISAHVGSGGATHAAATTATNGFMAAADKAKLDAMFGAGTIEVKTSSGTFAVPAGVTRLKLTLIGGGGSGARWPSSFGANGGGSSGGGGGTVIGTVNVVPGANIAYTVGAGGAQQNTQGAGGFDGGDTTMSGMTAGGGKGGLADTLGFYALGGAATGGAINVPGGAGHSYSGTSASQKDSRGGLSMFGAPGMQAPLPAQVTAGVGYGCGGYAGSSKGEAGLPGLIIIEY